MFWTQHILPVCAPSILLFRRAYPQKQKLTTISLATGTIEPGGWSTRELILILQGLSNAGLNIIGADIVELSPIFDNSAQTSSLLVVELIYELLHWMVNVPVTPPHSF